MTGEQHNAVVTDGELERGVHPIGKVVHISTVTHAWRGTLAAVDSTYYVFDASKPIALVDSTGSMSDYLGDMKQANDQDVFTPKAKKPAPVIRVLRAASVWMIEAP